MHTYLYIYIYHTVIIPKQDMEIAIDKKTTTHTTKSMQLVISHGLMMDGKTHRHKIH